MSSFSHFLTYSTITYGMFVLNLRKVMWGPWPHETYLISDPTVFPSPNSKHFPLWPKLGTLMWRYHHEPEVRAGFTGMQSVWSYGVPHSEGLPAWFHALLSLSWKYKNVIFELVFSKWTLRRHAQYACLLFCAPLFTNSIQDTPMDTEFQWTHDIWSSVRLKTSIKTSMR